MDRVARTATDSAPCVRTGGEGWVFRSMAGLTRLNFQPRCISGIECENVARTTFILRVGRYVAVAGGAAEIGAGPFSDLLGIEQNVGIRPELGRQLRVAVLFSATAKLGWVLGPDRGHTEADQQSETGNH